ncbi:hypothetical protein IIV6-T1_152 [Invertebrate iridescent virus 6]|nr:hypothetical protein IIV6-T1_152 [Invertebrate iridescent virus 6]
MTSYCSYNTFIICFFIKFRQLICIIYTFLFFSTFFIKFFSFYNISFFYNLFVVKLSFYLFSESYLFLCYNLGSQASF